MAHLYLGVIAKNADDFEEAKTEITKALQLCQSLGKLRGEMHARLNLANLARYKQDFVAARTDYEEVLQIARALGYRWGEAVTSYELADVMRGQGEYSLAIRQLEQALVILGEISEPFHANYVLTDVGRLHTYLGNYGRAWELIEDALRYSEHFTMPDAKLDTWLAAALLHHHRGEEVDALSYATQSYQAACERGSRRYVANALLYQAFALEGLQRWAEANKAYSEALQIYQQLDIQPTVAEAQAGLARIALAIGDDAAAQRWVQALLPILAQHPTVGLDEPFLIYYTCYCVFKTTGDPRASTLLQAGAKELQRYVSNIDDYELRHSFLEKVPSHRLLCLVLQVV